MRILGPLGDSCHSLAWIRTRKEAEDDTFLTKKLKHLCWIDCNCTARIGHR